MAYAFNPITGKLDLVGGGGSATTDASLLTSGTLALARLDPLVARDDLNNNFTAGQTITAPANTSALTASYSVTGANTTPLLDLSGTWNTTGVARGILLNITDTASATPSHLMDLSVGGSSVFRVRKDGSLTGNNVIRFGQGLTYTSSGAWAFAFGTTGCFWINSTTPQVARFGIGLHSNNGAGAFEVAAYSGGANIWEQYNGTAAQTFRLYNTRTDASNFERGFFRWNSNTLEIGTEAGGTGTQRALSFLGGSNNSAISFTANSLCAVFGNNANIFYKVGQFESGLRFTGNDTGISRNAAGVVEVNNGTAGTFRDLRVRNVIQASGVATTVTPSSNGDLVIEQTANTTLTFKMRGSDGTVRSATLTLA